MTNDRPATTTHAPSPALLPLPHADDRRLLPGARRTVPELGISQLVVLAVASVGANVALHQRGPALAASLSIAGFAAVLWRIGATRVGDGNRSRLLLIGAAVFGAWLSVRSSPWLGWLNTAAAGALMLGAALTAQPLHQRFGTSSAVRVLHRVLLVRFAGRVLAAATAPLRRGRATVVVPIFRGLIIAALPIMVLWALLSTADVLFAESLAWEIDVDGAAGHVALTLGVFATGTGVIAMATEPLAGPHRDRRPFGQVEAIVLLGGIALLFTAFAGVQLLSAFGDVDARLNEQGLTYAEYARGGFFQLLWVAALTATILGLTRLLIDSGSTAADRAARILGGVVSLLTCVIVVVAIVRLGHYNEAFGQTVLRWYSTAFAWMLGVGFVVIAVAHGRRLEPMARRLLPTLVVGTLLAANVLNPEARVAEHNTARADASTELDADYLVRLSADAWPVLLENERLLADRLDQGPLGPTDLREVCRRADRPAGYGLLGVNLATARLDCP